MSVREAIKHIKPPKNRYPDWLEKSLENPNQMSKLAPEQILYIPPEYRQVRNISYPLEPIPPAHIPISFPIPEPAPKHQVKVRAITNSGLPITNFVISVNIPDIASVSEKEKKVYRTNEAGEIVFSAYQGHTFNWNSPKSGWAGNGINRRRLESLVPMGGNFIISGPSELLLLPESGHSQLNGLIQPHQAPYE